MQYRTLTLTSLECKALWLCADIGYQMPNPDLERDPELEAAAERALDKVYRAEKGMGPRPTPPKNPRRGPYLDLRNTREGA